jgi:signal transduction histidine kinase
MRSAADHVAVTVHDDGPGFDQGLNPVGFGIGEILGRHLAEIGGKGEVQSVSGGGIHVLITIPSRQRA